MPYLKKTIIAGRTIEIRKSYAARYGCRGGRREKNHRPTPEDQRRVNERKAIDTLTWRLNANFGLGDVHLVLGYRRDENPTPEQARRHLEDFLRRARKYCAAQGKPLRYVTVTEYKRTRLHHHLVLPELPAAVLYALWPHGRPHPTPLDGSGNYRRLAEYLVKETAAAFREGDAPYKKRWNQSKNLKEPTIRVEVVNARTWSREPRPRKGYALDKDSLRQGVHEITGYPYQYYTLVRLRPEKERPEQERRGRL